MLAAQARYGLKRAQVNCAGLSLGRTLYPTVPEDVYDSGPVVRHHLYLGADVRLDNRAELAVALGLPLSSLERTSDTSLLFNCLSCWGESATERLVGEFAFAFWNGVEQKLILARDYLGFRPLYFHRGTNFIAFASMPSGLHALSEIPYDFDANVLIADLAGMSRQGRSTFFRHIERVEPATMLIATRLGVQTHRYWSPPRPELGAGRQDYAEGLRSLFDQAVRAQLRGAGSSVAAHLSSGLDSAIVATSAASVMPQGKVVAFTSTPRTGFDGPVHSEHIANEGPQAALTAARYNNIDHVIVPRSAQSPLDDLDRDFYFQQQPIANLCNAVWGRAINREVNKRDLKVLLVGSYGNMSVSYTGLQQLPVWLTEGQWIKLLTTGVKLLANGTAPRTIAAQTLGPFLPKKLWSFLLRRHGRDEALDRVSAVNLGAVEDLVGRPEFATHDFTWRPSRHSTELRDFVLSRSDGGNYYKGVLAEWGISMRDPTADKRVMEYCFAAPVDEYLRGGVSRSLGRRAFGARMAPEALTERRKGYQSADWYEALSADRAQVEDEIAAIARCTEAETVLDFQWLEQTANEWPTKGWAEDAVVSRYRYGLLRGIAAGHFMRKVKGTN